MITDSFISSVKIPICIEDGEIKLSFGEKLPKIADGTSGDLIIPVKSLIDKKAREFLSKKERQKILNQRQLLAVQLKKNPPVKDDSPLSPPIGVLGDYEYIFILDPLIIEFRGLKFGCLLPCKCHIQALDKEAKSINHAYTLLSEHFEKNRISHTGNVFQRVYYKEKDNKFYPLSKLRDEYLKWLEETYRNIIRKL